MTSLNQRLMRLEDARSKADIKAMSDEALDAHIQTLTFGTAECYAAIVARVLRHPSVFPVVKDAVYGGRHLDAGASIGGVGVAG